MNTGHSIGTRTFTDGSVRTVFLDLAGRQFVLDDDGKPVYGTWLPPVPPRGEARA